ncbi:unnamed protein product, partial [Choristocarpus tenellus]
RIIVLNNFEGLEADESSVLLYYTTRNLSRLCCYHYYCTCWGVIHSRIHYLYPSSPSPVAKRPFLFITDIPFCSSQTSLFVHHRHPFFVHHRHTFFVHHRHTFLFITDIPFCSSQTSLF